MRIEVGCRDQFFHDDVEHGACREGKKPWHKGRNDADDGDREKSENGFDEPRERASCEGFPAA